MTPDKQRVAIAKACGWKCNGDPDQLTATQGWQFAHQCVLSPEGKLVTHNSIPDYITDLNAMHEAEKVLIWRTDLAALDYDEELRMVTDGWRWSATAAQRAEAFLRTIGKWEEAK